MREREKGREGLEIKKNEREGVEEGMGEKNLMKFRIQYGVNERKGGQKKFLYLLPKGILRWETQLSNTYQPIIQYLLIFEFS